MSHCELRLLALHPIHSEENPWEDVDFPALLWPHSTAKSPPFIQPFDLCPDLSAYEAQNPLFFYFIIF